jgi:hypothetical protein
MSTLFTTAIPPTPAHTLQIGQHVHVNTRAAWYPAQVTSITHTRIGVTFDLAPSSRLAAWVTPALVRPADGVRLQPVQALRGGDDLLAYDGTVHTLTDAWPARDHRWILDYTSGTRTSVPAHAILRLPDHTPPVTINGTPLGPSPHPAPGHPAGTPSQRTYR